MLNTDKYRANFKPYIQRAFQSLPYIDNPKILDAGCGTGVPAMILAELTNGTIDAVDIDENDLASLNHKAQKAGFDKRVRTTKCSMLEMPFPENYFDIIWAEGSIAIIGFEKGLSVFQRFLKQNSYMVIHDDGFDIEKKILLIENYGFKLISSFVFDDKIWWELYYGPLQEEIDQLSETEKSNPDLKYQQVLRELKMFEENPKRFKSVYFILSI
jgi:ubiquinone/menaquinone biosynthesis C-methylase UbiE